MKMVWETQKIFNDQEIAITATTVRVPVYRSHSEAITIETEQKISAAKARQLLEEAPGVIVQDDLSKQLYPMPLYTSNLNEVFVGRIREDISHPTSLNLWVVGDQIRKGAALNALQIAEYMIEHNLI
jgi:aspartate-semialdehyde dehydrogenase